MQSFDYLVIDTVNLAYQVFNPPKESKAMKEISVVMDKKVYPFFIASFIDTINYLEAKFLVPGGQTVFLFDNYSSREQLRELLKPLPESAKRKSVNAGYKASRKSAKLEFYNSLNLIRYYYLINTPNYHTARIPNLEADDLVKPCLDHIDVSKNRVLLITNDSDWTKYLSEDIRYLPEWKEEPQGVEEFQARYGFPPTEGSVTLYKIINGDTADNIDPVFSDFKKETKTYIVETYADTESFMYGAQFDDNLKEVASFIKDREKEIKLAYQMICAIPVANRHFEAVYTTGRNAVAVRNTLNNIFFDDPFHVADVPLAPVSEEFEFGGIKTPRREPKD